MVGEIQPRDGDIIFRFGGGLNTRESDDEINDIECSDGENFVLDVGQRQLRPRNGYEKIGTAPNSGRIQGFVTLRQSNGNVSFLVQAGTNVYEWDGLTTFTLITTVQPGARIRGTLNSQWELDDSVIVSDLAKAEPVATWDGTNFTTLAHNLTGSFYAKYCIVENERAHFANITSGTDTPHLAVASKRSDLTTLSVSDRPSSALAEDDPWFLPSPDLRAFNGLLSAFGRVIYSTGEGNIYQLAGSNSQDFKIDDLYPRSGATGEEAMAYIGNDVAYGRQGRIESLVASDKYGDVETDDLSLKIAPSIKDIKSFTTVYNSRLQRVYFFPRDGGTVWVMQKSLIPTGLSPWVPWTTDDSMDFKVTAAMSMLDPADELEYCFFGDDSGNIYRMEGSTFDDDGTDIAVTRTSKTFSAPLDAGAYDIQAWVKYRRVAYPVNINVTVKYGGTSARDQAATINIPVPDDAIFYGGGHYYNNSEYYGSKFNQRIKRQAFSVAGQSEDLQIKVEVTGDKDFRINEVGIRFLASKP